jgi:anti-sigma factor RsiW
MALGDPAGSEHAGSCHGCRQEVARLETVLEFLSEGADVAVPEPVDAAVRRALHQRKRPVLRPAAALAMGTAALAALVAGVSFPLAASELAETGPVVAGIATIAYLLFSGAVTIPILMWRPSRTGTALEYPQ